MSKIEIYHSTGNHYDEQSAYNNAFDTINRNNYRIMSTETDYDYCEGCGDNHHCCSITIELTIDIETDIAIKLKAALNKV